MESHFLSIDLSDRRFVFHATDIHGEFVLLDQALAKAGFDPHQDALVLNGDNVDRGPYSHRVQEYLSRKSWYSTKGNHEALLVAAAFEPYFEREHYKNGGAWFYSLDVKTRHILATQMNKLPIAIEVLWGGKKYGFVHADVCGNDWENFKQHLLQHEPDNTFSHALNARTRVKQILLQQARHKPISNIYEVFFGHEPVSRPFTYMNMSYMDTGASYTGNLSLRKLGDTLHSDINTVHRLF